jgi:hypothetical protein
MVSESLTASLWLQASGEGPLLDGYWGAVADALAKAIRNAVTRGGAVRDTLAHAFARVYVGEPTCFE